MKDDRIRPDTQEVDEAKHRLQTLADEQKGSKPSMKQDIEIIHEALENGLEAWVKLPDDEKWVVRLWDSGFGWVVQSYPGIETSGFTHTHKGYGQALVDYYQRIADYLGYKFPNTFEVSF